jgi:hypothetical protein
MTTVQITLPDALAKEAADAGLLASDKIAALLRDAMRKRQVDQLFDTMGKLAMLEPALTEAEIDAEIEAARAERARRR